MSYLEKVNMKDTKRAERRRNNARLFKRLYKQELGSFCCSDDREAHEKWAALRARKRVTTNVPCSCWMCCSERKVFGNGREARTFQERRAIDSMNEELVEISS